METKRKARPRKRKGACKKLRTLFNLEECIAEFNFIADEDLDYCHLEESHFEAKQQLQENNSNAAFVHFKTVKFELVTLPESYGQEGTHSCLIATGSGNSSNGFYLLLSEGDIRTCHLLTRSPPFEPKGLKWTFETSRWLFKAMKNPKSRKILRVDVRFANFENKQVLEFDLFLSKQVIIEDYAGFLQHYFQKNETVTNLMYFFYDIESKTRELADRSSSSTVSIDEFYSMVCAKQIEKGVFDAIVLPELDSLVPRLRTYQESAVKWMIHRELHNELKDHQIVFVKQSLGHEELHYNPHLGYFITEKVFVEHIANFKLSKGGILADEMGLGKTVETLALILHNQKRNVHPEYKFFNQSRLFSMSSNPLFGMVQCSCGQDSGISVIENTNLELLMQIVLQQKYWLNENLIKCLLCGCYQHLQCSRYEVDKDDFPYLCSRCWINEDPIDSGCTLVVCPKSISAQWEDEISKHLKGVTVYSYNGIRSNEYPCAANLAKYDIVITTYDVLRAELDFSSSHSYEHLRNSRRYFPPVSPLLSVRFWRLCFDEAQFVEGTFSRAAQMANCLSANYRWAITGTPIQQSVDDLFGLLYFIGEEPFCYKPIWNSALYNPYCEGNTEPLINAVVNCFWRTPKSAVINELSIMKPITIVKRLEFSQIERDFYQRQADKCKESIRLHFAKVNRDTKMADLSHTTRLIAFNLALKLRKTCCHPQICSNQIFMNSNKKFQSLEDVLDKMIEDMKYESEKSHREKIAAMNGKSGILLLKGDFKSAIDNYKAALDSITKHEEFFRTDKTQRFHVLYNLAEIAELFGVQQVDSNGQPFGAFNGVQSATLDFKVDSVDRSSLALTDEDKLMRVKAKQLYDEYILNEKLACITTDKYRMELVDNCNAIKENLTFNNGKWYIAALKLLHTVLDIEEIDAFLSQGQARTFASSATSQPSISSFQFKLDTSFEKIEDAREKMIDSFDNLLDQIMALSKVDEFIQCHVNKVKSTHKCILCNANKLVKAYEKTLFNIQVKKSSRQLEAAKSKEPIGENELETGNWNESNTVVSLRRLAQLYKSRAGVFPDQQLMVKEIDQFLKYLDELKKEFKAHRKFWTNLCEYVLRIDELNQAQTRITVPLVTDEIAEVAEAIYNVTLDQIINTMDFERANGERNLGYNLDRLKYLKNLKSSLKDKDNVESRVCSICWNDLTKYYVLLCGHFFCVTCLARLGRHSQAFNVDKDYVRCSVCRQESKKESLCCITSPQEQDRLEVLGSWSTKIVHIIRSVIGILESKEKMLIFSTWPDMLHIMKSALSANDINSCIVTSSDRRFADRIQTFKTSPTDNVLLLPTHFACNGLNLTEASHIIFINSSLNKADELQAIGRIYRIGQTKQTYIHKFIIDSTIEELIENHNETVFHKQKVANTEYDNMTASDFFFFFDY